MFLRSIVFLLLTSLIFPGCNNTADRGLDRSDTLTGNARRINQKPGSSYNDTIRIYKASAVFYEPDSIQHRRIGAANDKRIFESMDHELFYQARNARIELSANWPHLQLLTVRDARYLQFLLEDGRTRYIDLDSMQDMRGLLLFEPSKYPQFVDMMNIGSEASYYFEKKPTSKHD